MSLPILHDNWGETLIREITTCLGLTLTFDEQMQYLKSLETLDVQAAPGCGKTTLTGAKLCALASIWQSNVQGVCVLSHTNVAKDEIIRIVSSHPSGRRLLSTPHYIGTIQGFVDTFLALPYLRNIGIEIHAINDEVYARKAESRFGWQYKALKGMAKYTPSIEDHVKIATFVYQQGKRGVDTAKGKLPFGRDTDCYEQYFGLKNAMLKDGLFRYADMFCFAHEYIGEYPDTIAQALRQRFPLVIIDEAQDTSSLQDTLLSQIFSHNDVVLQRIGDVNQRIFNEESLDIKEGSFPLEKHLSLPQTMRFGSEIAKYASLLTSLSPQNIQGHASHTTHSPVLILFDKDSIEQVAATFDNLIKDKVEVTHLIKHGAKVLGARKQNEAQKFPSNLQDYFPNYQPVSSRSQFSSLVEACRHARSFPTVDGNYSQATDCLWEALQQSLLYSGVLLEGKRPTRKRIKDVLTQNGLEELQKVKQSLFVLAFQSCDTPDDWDERVNALFSNPSIKGKTKSNFCDYSPVPQDADIDDGGKSVDESFQVSTIHGAKGETHSATLIVECCYNQIFDLKEILPIFVGKHDKKRVEKTKTIQQDIKKIFVGMTRARSLVVFAILKEHISHEVISALVTAGWSLEDLTTSPDVLTIAVAGQLAPHD